MYMMKTIHVLAFLKLLYRQRWSRGEIICMSYHLQAQEQGRPPERTSKFYAKGALQYLIPILTQALTRQEELDDDDEWNPCKAAGVCLMLMATCCEDDVVAHVLPFVKDNISSPDWRFRDAAVMAFGQ